MGPTTVTRGRNDVQLAQNVAGADFKDFSYEVRVTSPSNGEENPDEITLETWHAGEAQKSANVVTQDAPRGMQQAEAAALAWSKKIAYLTYAL